MPFTRFTTWGVGALIFIMFLAGMSRILTMKEPAKIIGGAANAVSNLFRGVLK
jgi:hypothetical protein